MLSPPLGETRKPVPLRIAPRGIGQVNTMSPAFRRVKSGTLSVGTSRLGAPQVSPCVRIVVTSDCSKGSRPGPRGGLEAAPVIFAAQNIFPQLGA